METGVTPLSKLSMVKTTSVTPLIKILKMPAFSLNLENLKGDLDMYVKSLEQENPSLAIIRVRNNVSYGLSHARASGWRAATADVVAILDAHIEVHELW